MATAKTKKKYLVAGPEGDWLYKPVETETPELAVESVEMDANGYLPDGGSYDVYEVVSSTPVKLETRVGVAKRSS